MDHQGRHHFGSLPLPRHNTALRKATKRLRIFQQENEILRWFAAVAPGRLPSSMWDLRTQLNTRVSEIPNLRAICLYVNSP